MTAPGNIKAIYPLNPVQEGILFHTLYAPDSPLYIQQYVCDLEGSLDATAWRTAWTAVSERHEALRSLLTWEHRERPLQIVRASAPAEWHIEDWRELAAETQQRRFAEFLDGDCRKGFRLDRAPLQRFALFRLSDDCTRFVWTHHHVIIDGWSMGIVLDEVQWLYTAVATGDDQSLGAPADYRSYVQWSQSRTLEGAEDFWRTQLAGIQAATELRIELPGAPERWAESHAEHIVKLDAEVTSRLGELARNSAVTLSTVLRAAWAIVLGRYAGHTDVVFGATVAGRPAELPESIRMVGMFINTLPIRVTLDENQTLGELLAGIHRQHVEMVRYESTPLVSVQGWSDVPAGEPLFGSVLVVENVPAPRDTSGVDVRNVRYLQRSNYPLAILVMPGDELELVVLYDDQRYAPDAIERLGRQLGAVLSQLPAHAERPIRALQLLPPPEARRVLVDWNRTAAAFDDKQLIDDLILAAAEASPDTVAVAGGAVSVTYRQLVERSDLIAAALGAHGVGPGAIVGIAVGREPAFLVAMLGVLRSGAAYVPIDPAFPRARVDFILEDTGAQAIVTTAGASFDGGVPRIVVAADGAPEGLRTSPPPTSPSRSPDDLAYVLYTSGSTGTPKGVMVRHRNLVNSTIARADVYTRPVRSYLVLSPFVFDSSVAGIYWALTDGGTLVVPEPGLEQDVAALARMVRDHRVTHTLMLPSVWGLLLDLAEPSALDSLEVVIVAGEACPPSLVDRHFARLPGVELFNEYGPTEATVWSTVHPVAVRDGERLRVPIGRPIANTSVYLLDPESRPVPIGVPGELAVGGSNVTAGYLRRPDLTAAAFGTVDGGPAGEQLVYRTGDLVRWTADGTLDLLGRIDHQVKLRGQRIELGEIEAVLTAHASVADAVVVKVESEGQQPFLAAYVESAAGAMPNQAELADHARSHLPRVMVPSVICVLDSLPRGATGKVDRRALPDIDTPHQREPHFVPPRGPAEVQLAAIWADVLGVDTIGATDNFFELGGDSILSIRIIARANEAGFRITPRQFFDHPTVSDLVAAAQAG